MKTVLITGGATGIGRACAKCFRDSGYDVTVTWHETAPDLEGVRAVQCDLTDDAALVDLFRRVGPVEVLINNAGMAMIKMINDVTPQDYARVTAINEKAVYFCSKYAALSMLQRHSGAIINISSVWGQCGASCETLYSMTKAGVIGLTKALAQELAPSGISVNCIAPGVIDTRMNDCFTREELEAEIPLGRLGTPEEVARAALFLAENPYLTGQVLGVNGGMV